MINFNKNAVRPIVCLRESWQLIKDQYWLFVGICLIGILIGSIIPLGILLGAMVCGIYGCYLRKLKGERVSFEMLFRGFDYFKQSLIATLVIIIPMLTVVTPIYLWFAFSMAEKAKGLQNHPEALMEFFRTEYLPNLGLIMAVILPISIIIGMLIMFTYPLIVERGLSGLTAIKVSAKAVLSNLPGLLGLVFINMMISLVGMSCCYVGSIFVMPLLLGTIVIAYKQVFHTLQTNQ